MTRDEATAVVQQYIFAVNQFQAVDATAACFLLGDDRYLLLCKDKIRGIGPLPGSFYPWNVIDYLANPELGIKKD